MQLHCPHCGKQIRSDDANLENALAKCRNCHAVFSFADLADEQTELAQHAARHRHPREPVPLPRGLTMDETGPNLRFMRKWFSPGLFFLLVFCVIWDGFLVFWYSMVFREGPSLVMVLFPILHLVAGVFLTYLVVCGFVNRTVIELGSQLVIRHEPLPWPGNHKIDSGDVDQLFCRERITHSKNSTTVRYELHAITKAGQKLKLLSGLEESDHAIYLEEQIEQRLGIRDRHVRGEMPK